MSMIFFSVQANMVLDGKNIKGIVYFDEEGVFFLNGSHKEFHQVLNWKDVRYTFTQEKIQTFLFFSSKKTVLTIEDNNTLLPKIVIEPGQRNDISNKLNIKENLRIYSKANVRNRNV